MSKGERPSGAPVNLMVNTVLKSGEQVRVTVPIDATVGEFVVRVMSGMGVDDPEEYNMYVPLAREGGDPEWHELDDHETLLDAMRGIQHPPRILNGDSDQ